MFVTAVAGGRDIGFAWGDAPYFRLHLVRVPGGGYITGGNSAFADSFFASPAGTGAVFNVIAGPPAEPAAGPLRFVSLTGARTRQVADANISFPVPTPFSPTGKLLLAQCPAGQCVLDAATGATVDTIPVLGDNGNPAWPARDIGWYDDSHFLSWIAVTAGADRYELVTVDLSGLVTSIVAIDRDADIPQLNFTAARAG